MQVPEPTAEHHWLQKLVGEWTCEADCQTAPDQPVEKVTGTDSVTSLGKLWVICRGDGEVPGSGDRNHSILTLGFDPLKKKFVGSFVASVMTYFWPYEGTLDASGKKLELASEGPSFSGKPEFDQYLDVIEMITDDHRTLTSHTRDENGQWKPFMTMHYYRKK
ncbi:DUF1579 domain-containing protein [Anatilimnocola sp. NA78]|uniref:DUF1579 domain-containing protein n=1 Tax=Anatilimnocola sp. NA78 TaxID=3415683 RepID=UPI003CE582C7